MMEQPEMKVIMETFATKMLLNLAYYGKTRSATDSQRIVDVSIAVLAHFMSSGQGCRLFGNTNIMQNVIAKGISSFQIL